MDELTCRTSPTVTFLTSTHRNVPMLFKYEDAPVVEVIRDAKLG
jgi:hypothetical protein